MPRLLCRSLNRSLIRAPLRSITTGTCRRKFLNQALTAFRHAIRASRRLMKLAPRFFDSAVVDRERSERLERLAWRAKWEPALLKIYGDTGSPPPLPDDLPRIPESPFACRAIDHEIEQRELWMQAGRCALADYQNLQPHAWPTFSQMARLLEIGITFGRLASGLETTQPKPEPLPPIGYTAEAALLKIYGEALPEEPAENENR